MMIEEIVEKTKKQIKERIRIIQNVFREINEYQLNLKYQYPKLFKEYKQGIVDLAKGKFSKRKILLTEFKN